MRDDEHIIGTTASDLRAVAQDMLRMGRHWTQAAQGWLEQRREGHAGPDMRGDGDGDAGAKPAGGYRGIGPRNYNRSDERIREDLGERFTDADDLDASGLTVEVSNGVATLGGRVRHRWMKHRAEDLAVACGGVRDVRNQIQVGQPAPDLQGSLDATGT